MKLSLIASRAIFGLGVLGSVSICAQEITINSSGEIRTYFDIDQNENLSIKDSYKNGDLTINMAYNGDLNNDVASEENEDKTKLNIDLGENNLIFKATTIDPQLSNYIGNVNFTAKTITLEDMHLQAIYGGSVINGDTTISGKTDVFTNSNGEITINRSPDEFGSVVTVATNMPDLDTINGSLTINGNFNADKTYFNGFNVGKNYLNFNINGEANIKNSVISVGNTSLNSLVLDRFVFASADKFNSDITTSNVASGSVMKHASEVISDKNLADDFIKEQNYSYFTPMDVKDFTDYKLSVDKSNGKESLIVSGGFSDKISDTKALLQFEIDYLKAAAKESEIVQDVNGINGLLQAKENATEIEKKVVEDFNKQIQAKQEMIDKITSSGEDSVSTDEAMGAMGIEVTDTTKYIFENTKNSNGAQKNNYIALLTTGTMGGATNTAKTADSMQSSGNLNEAQGIFDSLINSNINASVGIGAITNKNFFKDVRESAKSSTDTLNNNSSVNGAINISNDMALGGRIARINNPYSEIKFANALKTNALANNSNIASDIPYDYYGTKTYKNSVWANAFGGANIVDGESGGLYGISIGADKEFNENLLLGIYATYASSKIKDKLSVQESDNYQIGIYSSYRFNHSWELNSKLYGQIGDTKQDINLAGSLNNADFNRKFIGFNTNIGKVFNLNNGLFLKPFVGANYYYSYTPSYDEKGSLARKVESNTNNSLSLELGLEARKYFNESSYLFITPKIEQYVVNNGEDYVASFVGSNTSFSIKGEEKKKTYGQLIVGGNISLNDSLSLDVGIGAKQILAGKVDSKNETYLSGNMGIKYKF